MPTIRPELCLQPDTVKTSNWSCIANADREILGLSSESVESEPGLANAKRREAPVLAREPKETAAIFEKHRKKSSSISPNINPQPWPSSETAGAFFYFVCAEISFAEMWKEEVRGRCGPTGPDLSSPSGSYSIRGGGLKRLTN
jgi:hypothetical protein